MNDKVKLYKEIETKIRLVRLENEIKYYEDVINKKSPKDINDNDGFFNKTKKKLSNNLNKNEYEFAKKTLDNLKNIYDDLLSDSMLKSYSIDNDIEFKEKVSLLFNDDKFSVAKLEFVMSIILDNTFAFTQNGISYPYLSDILGYNEDYLSLIEKKLRGFYQDINIKKSDLLRNACIISVCIAPALLITGFAGGLFVGSIFSEAMVGLLVGGGLVATAGLTYVCLKEVEREKLKEEFSKLNVEETSLNLAKTIVLIEHMNNVYTKTHDEEAEEIYESFVDEYIDLKSDVDLRLFINKENVDLNDNKNKVFHNADQLLKKTLQLVK